MAVKWNIDLVRKYVEEHGDGDELVSDTYINSSSKLLFKCARCNHEYSTVWTSFHMGCRCQRCALEKLWNKSRKSKESVIRELEDSNYIIIDDFEYKNNESRINIKDSEGYKYNISFVNFISNVENEWKPKRFYKYNPHTIDNINNFLEKENSKCRVEGGTYSRFSAKTLIAKCDEGHLFNTSLSILWNCHGKGCPICAGKVVSEKNSLSSLFPELVAEWSYDKNECPPSSFSMGSNKKVFWICKNGHDDYLAAITNRVAGRGCPICGIEMRESKVATYLKKYCIEKYGIEDAIPEYKLVKNPKTNYFLKNDIYIKSLELHIEVMGGQHYIENSQFYHTKEQFEKQLYRDEIKRAEVRRLGHNYLEIDTRKIKRLKESSEILETYIENLASS